MTQGWHLKSIYLYLVCFVTLLMIVFGFISFLSNVGRVVFPDQYSYYYQTLMEMENEYVNNKQEVPAVTEMERIRDERLNSERARARAYLLRDLISSLAVWLIPIPFYLYHWRKVREGLFPVKGGIQA